MVFMEDSANCCVRGVGGDGQNSVAAEVDEESGLLCTSSLDVGSGNCLMAETFSGRGRILSESTL